MASFKLKVYEDYLESKLINSIDDDICEIKVDDKVFKAIIITRYYSDEPAYEPNSILCYANGTIYEYAYNTISYWNDDYSKHHFEISNENINILVKRAILPDLDIALEYC